MFDSFNVLEAHERTPRTFSILKQTGSLSPGGTNTRADRSVVKLTASGLGDAKVASTDSAALSWHERLSLTNLPCAMDSACHATLTCIKAWLLVKLVLTIQRQEWQRIIGDPCSSALGLKKKNVPVLAVCCP